MAIGDIHFDKVSLLLGFETASDNATNTANPASDFVDSSRHGLVPYSVNSMRLRTSKKMLGSGSAEVWNWSAPPGLSYLPGEMFDFGVSDFTIEFGYRPNGVSGGAPDLIGSDGAEGMGVILSGSAIGLRFGVINQFFGPSLPAGVFTRVMLSRAAGVFYLFYDGVRNTVYDYGSSKTTPWRSFAPFRVGAKQSSSDRAYGFYDEVRVTKGVARATASYTPSATAFPTYAAQFLGNVKDATGTNAARAVRAYREDTGAFVGSTTSDAVTGNYTLNSAHGGACTLVFYPAAGETALNAVVLRGVTPV